ILIPSRRTGAAALLWISAVIILALPTAEHEYTYRYVIPAVPLVCMAAALAFRRPAGDDQPATVTRHHPDPDRPAPRPAHPVPPPTANPRHPERAAPCRRGQARPPRPAVTRLPVPRPRRGHDERLLPEQTPQRRTLQVGANEGRRGREITLRGVGQKSHDGF